jgi:hypothetical protein
LGLFELLRIAEEDDAPCSLRHRQDVRQRHLPRLVDEEHVDRTLKLRTGPEPRGTPRHLSAAVTEPIQHVPVVGHLLDVGELSAPRLHLLHTAH